MLEQNSVALIGLHGLPLNLWSTTKDPVISSWNTGLTVVGEPKSRYNVSTPLAK
jgi:hypothetical protein